MGKVILLGTASFIPTEEADNTHLAILAGNRKVLVDTATNPFLSLKKGGIEPNVITDLVLTHFHPDHVSGLPILIMGMWFTGRKTELYIHGLDYTLDRAKKMLESIQHLSLGEYVPCSLSHNCRRRIITLDPG